jgi:hypothetical protein
MSAVPKRAGCQSCGGHRKYLAVATKTLPHSEPAMILRSKSENVQLRNGAVVPLYGSLIRSGKRPSGGWFFNFRVRGIDFKVNGISPQQVARQVHTKLKQNGVSISPADLWLNLNLQWMNRLDHEHFTVTREALTSLIKIEAEDQGKPEDTSLRKSFTPEQWGSRAWKWLGLYLAQDDYNPIAFLLQLEAVLGLLNPMVSPATGCIKCYTEFSAEMQNIRNNMPRTLDDARKWLWSFHNKVNRRIGKPEITFLEARTLNFWT